MSPPHNKKQNKLTVMWGMRSGFTLLEVLIYSLILAIFIGATAAFVTGIFGTTETLLERGEVVANQEFIERKISRFAPFATAIIVPPANGSSTAELRITVADAALNPVVFSLAGENLNLSTGGGTAVPINNNRVSVPAFRAEHFVSSSSPPILRVYLEIKDKIYPVILSTTTLNYVLP